MRDIVLAAEELNDLLHYKKPNLFQRKINQFLYNKVKKKIFKEIKKDFLSGEVVTIVQIPDNYKQKMVYEDVLEHFRFLGYKVEDGIYYYHIKWPNKQEQKNNKVTNNTEEDYFLCNSSLECFLKKRQIFNQIEYEKEKDKVIKNIKSSKGLRSI